MKKNIFTKENVAIALFIAIMMIVWAFAEIGIATAFNLKVSGMDYAVYAKTFYQQHPWMIPLVVASYIGVVIFTTKIVKNLWEEINMYFKEKYQEAK